MKVEEFMAAISSADSSSELEVVSLAELRARREEANRAESVVSFSRRIVQARIDIVDSSLSTESAVVTLDQLPQILSEERSPGSSGRMVDVVLSAEEQEASESLIYGSVGMDRMADLSIMTLDEKVEYLRRLKLAESSISQMRRQLHEHLDRLTAEVVRRYKSGSAAVDDLLHTSQ